MNMLPTLRNPDFFEASHLTTNHQLHVPIYLKLTANQLITVLCKASLQPALHSNSFEFISFVWEVTFSISLSKLQFNKSLQRLSSDLHPTPVSSTNLLFLRPLVYTHWQTVINFISPVVSYSQIAPCLTEVLKYRQRHPAYGMFSTVSNEKLRSASKKFSLHFTKKKKKNFAPILLKLFFCGESFTRGNSVHL